MKEEIRDYSLEIFNKDLTIRYLHRIDKSLISSIFSHGYMLFSTNPNSKFLDNDTIFSNQLSSSLDQCLLFDYDGGKIKFKIKENTLYNLNPINYENNHTTSYL